MPNNPPATNASTTAAPAPTAPPYFPKLGSVAARAIEWLGTVGPQPAAALAAHLRIASSNVKNNLVVAEKHGAIKIIGKSHRGKLYSVPGGPEGDPWLRPVQRVVAALEAPALANGATPGPSSVFALAAHLAAPPVATALKQSPRRSTPPRLSPRNQKGGAGPTTSPSAATTSTPNDPQTWKAASKTRKKPGCASSTQTTQAPAQRPEHTPVVLVPTTPANAVQHGGTHYKQLPIEPWDYIVANGLGFLEGNAIKYLTRWRSKGGIDDLKKAAHYVHKLIEVATHTPPRTV